MIPTSRVGMPRSRANMGASGSTIEKTTVMMNCSDPTRKIRRRSEGAGLTGGLVVVARDLGPTLAHQEIEIDAVISLQHMLDIELDPPAISVRRGRAPGCAAASELGVVDVDVQAALGDIERD